jgi:hypothetical protein
MSGFHKMLQVRPPTIIKQIETHGVTYLLDGVGKKRGKVLLDHGCKWLRGRPGCWEVTEDIAKQFIERGVEVIENDLRKEENNE